MQTQPRTHWSDILLIILGLLGLLAYWGIAALMAISGLVNISDSVDGIEASQPLVFAAMFGFTGFLLIPGLWLTFRKMSGRIEPDGKAGLPFALWHIPLLLIIWAIGLFGGQWASQAPDPAWLLLPVLVPLCVLPPIWLMIGLAGRGYNFRPLARNWNTMTIGTTLGPFLILIIEVIALGVLLTAVVLYFVLQPERMASPEALAFRMQMAQTEEQLLSALGPLVVSPVFMFLVLFAVSFVVPLIEEILKPLAVWVFARQLNTRLDGFVLGALSGAAYAIFETGGISPAAGTDWLALLGARGGTSLLQIATSAWMGSAIVPAIRERKWGQLFGVYFLAILLHGTWNALSIFNGFGPAADGQPGGQWIVAVGQFSAYGLGALALIFLALVIYQQSHFQNLHSQFVTDSPMPVPDPALAAETLPTEPENPESVIR